MKMSTRIFNVKMPRTFATVENAVKAVEKTNPPNDFRYLIAVDAVGRFFPVFLGEKCVSFAVGNHFAVTG
jgi:hypothetical protein